MVDPPLLPAGWPAGGSSCCVRLLHRAAARPAMHIFGEGARVRRLRTWHLAARPRRLRPPPCAATSTGCIFVALTCLLWPRWPPAAATAAALRARGRQRRPSRLCPSTSPVCHRPLLLSLALSHSLGAVLLAGPAHAPLLLGLLGQCGAMEGRRSADPGGRTLAQTQAQAAPTRPGFFFPLPSAQCHFLLPTWRAGL